MLLRLVSLVMVAGLAVGCGPYMDRDTIAVLAYQAPERCGQGPYEIVVPARGGRWGEGVEVVAYSPRQIEGRYEVSVGDEVLATGAFERRQVPSRQSTAADPEWAMNTSDAPTDNARCLAPDAQRAIAESTSGGEAVVVPASPSASGTIVSDTPVEASSVELREVRWGRWFELTPAQMSERGLGRVSIVERSWHPRDPENDPTPPLAPDTPIRIRLWSNLPNDLEGVSFVVAHTVARPSVSDEEWIAHLRAEREERARQDRARHEAEQRRLDAWTAHCNAHHEDTQCWGPGGYEGAIARRRRAEEDAPRLAREREELARQIAARQAAQAASAPPPPPPAHPEGPPPPPRAEARPPQPSVHATWTPGYWHWHAARWVWIGGSWEVPPEDLERDQTVQAPHAPPPLQVEVQPAAPAPQMVWVPGYWQWDGARFVWIAGRWDLPRSQGATWQAPSWRPGSRGAVFVPGRWQVRIGR